MWFPNHRLTEGTEALFQDTVQNLRRHKLLPSRIWLLLRRSPETAFHTEKFASIFVTLLRFSCSRMDTSNNFLQLVFLLYFWWNANRPSNLSLENGCVHGCRQKHTEMRECLSMSSILSPGGRFIIVRNLVFTLYIMKLVRHKDCILLMSSNRCQWTNPIQRVAPCWISDQTRELRSETSRARRCRRNWHCWRPWFIIYRFRFGGNSFFTIPPASFSTSLESSLEGWKADVE